MNLQMLETTEITFYIVASLLFLVLCCCPSRNRGDILSNEWNPPLCILCCRCIFLHSKNIKRIEPIEICVDDPIPPSPPPLSSL
jgi:hypothetical protein